MALGSTQLHLCIIAILLPPVAVVLQRGCGSQLAINIILTILLVIPGIVHAIYLVLHDDSAGRPPRHIAHDAHPAMVGPTSALGQQDGSTTPRPGTPQPTTQRVAAQPMAARYNHDGSTDFQPLPPMYNGHKQHDIARAGPGMVVSGTQLRSTATTSAPQTQSRGNAMEEV